MITVTIDGKKFAEVNDSGVVTIQINAGKEEIQKMRYHVWRLLSRIDAMITGPTGQTISAKGIRSPEDIRKDTERMWNSPRMTNVLAEFEKQARALCADKPIRAVDTNHAGIMRLHFEKGGILDLTFHEDALRYMSHPDCLCLYKLKWTDGESMTQISAEVIHVPCPAHNMKVYETEPG